MPKYEYTGPTGKHLGQDGNPIETGEVVELTDERAAAFKDRFKPVEGGEAKEAKKAAKSAKDEK